MGSALTSAPSGSKSLIAVSLFFLLLLLVILRPSDKDGRRISTFTSIRAFLFSRVCGFFLQCLSQPIHFSFFEHPVPPRRQTFQIQRPQPDPLEFLHRMLPREQRPPQRVPLRIPQRRLIPEISHPAASAPSQPARCVRLPDHPHPRARLFPQPLQIFRRQSPFHFYLIHLRQIPPIAQHLRRQIAVICQEHQPRCRIVQSPHSINALRQSS